MACLAGDFIEHVDEVKEKNNLGRVAWIRQEAVDEGLCGVDDKVSAAGNGNAKLAIRKKILNDFIAENGHEERAGKTAKRGADTKWRDAGKVIGIFMESNKVIGGESIVDRGGELIV